MTDELISRYVDHWGIEKVESWQVRSDAQFSAVPPTMTLI